MRPTARSLLLRVLHAMGLCLLAGGLAAAKPNSAPAEPPPPAATATVEAPPPAPPAPDPEAEKKETAKQRFLRGLDLARNDDMDAALVEFLAANELYPTRAATLNAARAQLFLKRYVDALATYELLLQKWGGDLKPEERKPIEDAITKLRELTADLTITSDQPGTTIVVDGQELGATPLAKPVRVKAGTHVVRAFKEGFVPFESQVMVAGGQGKAVAAQLKALTKSGRLRVTESAGLSLDVVVDGAVVGKTPWEGLLAPGSHTVLLKGEAQMGTLPTSVEVKENETAPLSLSAVKLDAVLRIEPTPANARVAIDGVTLGAGVWQGQITSGSHKVEVFAPGFLGFSKDIPIQSGATENVKAVLQRNLDDPIWSGFRPHVYVDAMFGGTLSPSFGGSADQACGDGDCSSRTPPLGIIGGVRGGYAITHGFGVELFVGYLTLREKMTRKQTATADSHVQSLESNDYEDATRITGPMAALSASYQLLDKTPLTFRLWVGAARVKATFGNGGNFHGTSKDPNSGQTGKFDINFDLEEQQPNLWVPFVGPEVRFGIKLSSNLTLDVGFAGLVMFPAATDRKAYDGGNRSYAFGESKSKYPDGTPIPAPGDVELKQETGFGTMVTFTPSIGARYDF